MRVIDANEIDVVSCCFFNVDAKGFWRRRISGSSDIETFKTLGEFLRMSKTMSPFVLKCHEDEDDLLDSRPFLNRLPFLISWSLMSRYQLQRPNSGEDIQKNCFVVYLEV